MRFKYTGVKNEYLTPGKIYNGEYVQLEGYGPNDFIKIWNDQKQQGIVSHHNFTLIS